MRCEMYKNSMKRIKNYSESLIEGSDNGLENWLKAIEGKLTNISPLIVTEVLIAFLSAIKGNKNIKLRLSDSTERISFHIGVPVKKANPESKIKANPGRISIYFAKDKILFGYRVAKTKRNKFHKIMESHKLMKLNKEMKPNVFSKRLGGSDDSENHTTLIPKGVNTIGDLCDVLDKLKHSIFFKNTVTQNIINNRLMVSLRNIAKEADKEYSCPILSKKLTSVIRSEYEREEKERALVEEFHVWIEGETKSAINLVKEKKISLPSKQPVRADIVFNNEYIIEAKHSGGDGSFCSRELIRKALGQIIEYNYYAVDSDLSRYKKMGILLDLPLDADDEKYLKRLNEDFKIKLKVWFKVSLGEFDSYINH